MDIKFTKLEHETFKKPTKNFWHDWQNQKESYDSVTIWWEIGKLYFKMLATHYCVQMQKNIRNKQTELTETKKTNQTRKTKKTKRKKRKKQTKSRSTPNKQSKPALARHRKL